MNLRGCLLAAGLVLVSGAPVLARPSCPAPATPDCVITALQANDQQPAQAAIATPTSGSQSDAIALIIKRR